MLEIAVCAQHNNGGIAVDDWWHSAVIDGLFPVGEAAGAHGVYRPGGAALSGQVGATRAAQYIAAHRADPPVDEGFDAVAIPSLERATRLLADAVERFRSGRRGQHGHPDHRGHRADEPERRPRALPRVRAGGAGAVTWLERYEQFMVIDESSSAASIVFLIHDILTSHVYLAMKDYLDTAATPRLRALHRPRG